MNSQRINISPIHTHNVLPWHTNGATSPLSLPGLSRNDLYGDCRWKSLANVLNLNAPFFACIILHSSFLLSSKDIYNDNDLVSFVVLLFYAMFLLSTQTMLRPPRQHPARSTL